MINKDLEKKLKKNMEFSENLCEVLNKYVKGKKVEYTAIASNEDVWICEGCLYINNEEFYIEDIESIKINKDIIELQLQDENEKWCKVSVKRGLKVEMEEIKKNKMIPFNIIFNDE